MIFGRGARRPNDANPSPLRRGSPAWLANEPDAGPRHPIGRHEALRLRARLFSPIGLFEIDLRDRRAPERQEAERLRSES